MYRGPPGRPGRPGSGSIRGINRRVQAVSSKEQSLVFLVEVFMPIYRNMEAQKVFI